MTARSPFVVLFLERSGSSHLCSLLDSHPQISCGAEEFTIRKLEGDGQGHEVRWIHARRTSVTQPSQQQAISHLESIFARSRWAAGFKFKYPMQVQRFPEVYQRLVDMKSELRVVHLDRENVLKKAISKQILEQQRKEPAFRRDRVQRQFSPVRVDVEKMMGQLNRAKHQRVQLQALVDRFPHRLPIEYDQLYLDSAAVGRQLESFLGVEVGQPMKSRFKKVAPDRLSDAVLNFEDIAAAIRQTEFESLLDS